ncbi:hypothetical protein [Chryseobacterium sp. BIGb0232]|uniref:hypothetical protein n=1 Tax=Chryseobacterium sp. BIGb0232 TaxID=2940598 RepID=UPI000F461C16|nr:hypothetical protein [Chryseobacterium sp. BIGb0232]MCS4303011.1 hypothetical protein [Chryseobacterium sp. BIGb0232]
MKSFLITMVLFLGVGMVYLFLMMSGTENYFTYILDDAYIHLAIAKNFAFHGVWGVTQYSFSSTSSSPVFTVILSSLIYVFGDHELIPLLFNTVTAFFMIFFLNKYFSDYFSEARSVIAAVFFTVLFTSVPMLVFSGMEHVLQAMVIVVNVLCFERWKGSEYKDNYCSGWFYSSLALLGLIRFDSMFYFLALALVFILLRRFTYAAGVLICGFIPILIFGYFTHQETGYFFPNSVIIKGSRFDLSGNYFMQVAGLLYHKILDNRNFYFAGILPLLISAVLIAKDIKKGLGFQQILSRNLLLIVWCITLFLHGAFSKFTKLYRYEVYILTGFAMAVIPKLKSVYEHKSYLLKENRGISVLIFLSFVLLMVKVGFTSYLTVVGSRNVYEQQIQSARFLKKYYPNAKVVANDIGAICYFTDIHLLDFEGLGSKEVVPFRMRPVGIDDQFERFLKSYTIQNGYQFAIAYEEWLQGHTPENWKKVAVLTVSGSNALLGEDHLYIYSIDPRIHNTLREQVKNFNWNKNITVKIID